MVKRRYNKIKKKGEGWELTKILSYAIGLIVFVAVIFAFYANAPAITKGFKVLQTKGVELVEGVKPIIDDTFKLLDPEGKKRRIERILVEYESCGEDKDNNKIINEYQKAISEAVKYDITDKQKLLNDLRTRLARCYSLKSDSDSLLKLGKGLTSKSNKDQKTSYINFLIDSALASHSKKAIDLAKSEAEKLFGKNLPGEIEDKLKRLDFIAKSLSGSQIGLEELRLAYKNADTLNRLNALKKNEKFKELFKKETTITKAIKENIDFNIKLKEAKLKNNCNEFKSKLKEYYTNKKYETILIVNKEGVLDPKKSISAKALKEVADSCLKDDIKTYNDNYLILLDKFSAGLGNKKNILNELNKRCLSENKVNYRDCKDLKQPTNSQKDQGLFKCFWTDTIDDSATLDWNKGSCKSCIDVNPKSCEAYSKSRILQGGKDYVWITKNYHPWYGQCESDPCGFGGCKVDETESNCIPK